MIEINTDQAIEDLRAMSRDLTGREFARAVKLGLNDGIRRGRTRMVREVIDHFNNTAFTPSGVRSAMSIQNASNNNLTAKLLVSGKPISLRYFGARQTSTGISVEILKGQRKQIRSAFMIPIKGKAGRNVFARGQYENNQFVFRNKRIKRSGPDLPISKLLSVSLPSAIYTTKTPITQNVGEEIEPYALERIVHHITQIRAGNLR